MEQQQHLWYYCNNKQLCGLKTWLCCCGSLVACPALPKIPSLNMALPVL